MTIAVKNQWAVGRLTDKMSNDLLLPAETVRVRRDARTFADDVLRPAAHELNCTPETRDGFRYDIFNAITAAGLYRVPYPADVGGLGLEFPTLAALTVLEELGYYSPGIASAMYDGQAILVGKTLDAAGGAARATWLPKIVRGEIVGSFATSEPEASTDLSVNTLKTTAQQVEGGWRINGRKRWITNSVAADRVLLLCRTEANTSTFFVDMHAAGVRVAEPDRKMGNHAQLTADIFFEDVFVTAADVVGTPGPACARPWAHWHSGAWASARSASAWHSARWMSRRITPPAGMCSVSQSPPSSIGSSASPSMPSRLRQPATSTKKPG